MSPGCWIGFHWYRPVRIVARVEDVLHFENARTMLSTIGCPKLLPTEPDDIDHCTKLYESMGQRYKGPMVAYKLATPRRFESYPCRR